MNDFWSNIFRYPRFFISSLIGLLVTILTPFQNLFKIKKLRVILPFILLIGILIIYNILINMLGF